MKRDHIILSLILLAAFSLRSWGVGDQPFWWDEQMSLRCLSKPHWWQVTTYRGLSDRHLFAYYAVLRQTYRVALKPLLSRPVEHLSPLEYTPYERWVIRLPSMLLGVLAAGMMYRWSQVVLPPGGGLLCAWLAAIWPPLVLHSREVRMYMPYLVLAMWQSAAFWRAVNGQGWWWKYGMATAPFLFVHFFAHFLVAAQGAYALGRAWKEGRGVLGKMAAALAGPYLLFSAFFLWNLQEMIIYQQANYFPASKGLWNYPLVLVTQGVFGRDVILARWWEWLWMGGVAGLGLLGTTALYRRVSKETTYMASQVLVPFLILGALAGNAKVWLVKYQIFAVPFLLVFVAAGVLEILKVKKVWQKAVVWGLIIALHGAWWQVCRSYSLGGTEGFKPMQRAQDIRDQGQRSKDL